jgi:hypothetical protein
MSDDLRKAVEGAAELRKLGSVRAATAEKLISSVRDLEAQIAAFTRTLDALNGCTYRYRNGHLTP